MKFNRKSLVETAKDIVDMYMGNSNEISVLAKKNKLVEASYPAIDYICSFDRDITEEDVKMFNLRDDMSKDTKDMLVSLYNDIYDNL